MKACIRPSRQLIWWTALVGLQRLVLCGASQACAAVGIHQPFVGPAQCGIDVITTNLGAPLHCRQTHIIEIHSMQVLQRPQVEQFFDAVFPTSSKASTPVEVFVYLSATDGSAHIGTAPVVQGSVMGISPV